MPSAGIFQAARVAVRSALVACSVHQSLSTAVGTRKTCSFEKPRDFKYSTPPDDETSVAFPSEKIRRTSHFLNRNFQGDCALQLRRLCESVKKRIGVAVHLAAAMAIHAVK